MKRKRHCCPHCKMQQSQGSSPVSPRPTANCMSSQLKCNLERHTTVGWALRCDTQWIISACLTGDSVLNLGPNMATFNKGGHLLFFAQSASAGPLFRNSASTSRWSAIIKNLLVCQRWSAIPLPLFFPQCAGSAATSPLFRYRYFFNSVHLSRINCKY